MVWNFDERPELPNSQMALEYWASPHKQIFEDFRAEVIKVIDGDTIRLKWEQRDFDFPLRILDIDAPEMNAGGARARDVLKGLIENSMVDIIINKKNRVGKFGRILGKVKSKGIDMGEFLKQQGLVTSFAARRPGEIPNINRELVIKF